MFQQDPRFGKAIAFHPPTIPQDIWPVTTYSCHVSTHQLAHLARPVSLSLSPSMARSGPARRLGLTRTPPTPDLHTSATRSRHRLRAAVRVTRTARRFLSAIALCIMSTRDPSLVRATRHEEVALVVAPKWRSGYR